MEAPPSLFINNSFSLATMAMKFAFHIIILIIFPIYLKASAQYSTVAKSSCKTTCGGIEIPYPFGMKNPQCYAAKWFEIECRNSTTSGEEKLHLKSIDLEVIMFDVTRSTVVIKNPIFHSNCERKDALPIKNMGGSPFAYSQVFNKFEAVGCNNIALLQSHGSGVSGCVSICNDGDGNDIGKVDLGYAECHGMNCCETTLPSYLQEYNVTIKALRGNNGCGYALIVQDYRNVDSPSTYVDGHVKDLDEVPAVLDWEIPYNSTFKPPADVYAKCFDSNITSSQHSRGSGWTCRCVNGYEGNAYIAGGCKVVDGFPHKRKISPASLVVTVGVSSILGSIILLLALRRLIKVVRKKIIKKRKEKFFKQNGGLLLQQRLSSDEVKADKVKIFSLKDLEKATDKFNINRILGKGGQGTVYKGMLIDGKIVAVKKFNVEGKVEEFINEFLILSEINHRNVVKLLGCCLETEIPLLVYEFIPNGNLFEYLHKENVLLTWDMRLRVAIEIAGALFYLHSAASRPIYHRDIKSTNILLDEKYRAKVADFGTSRMVSIEATHLTTKVQGTFGYLDPEYFRTSQFTEKSDVYSFGVVLVELLTRQKPISYVSPEEVQSLASYFILCIEENRLFDIIDERVKQEGEKEHIFAVANLANKCLELNGKKRPTMKEIILELEGIQQLEKRSRIQENLEEHEFLGIEDNPSWIVYSAASDTGSTLTSETSTLEIMPILSNNS